MRFLLAFLILFLGPVAYSAIVSPVTFKAEVIGFDKKWVQVKANDKSFPIARTLWEQTNGPARTGVQKASLDPHTFALLMEQLSAKKNGIKK